jgi:hypothetical protein
MADWDDPVPSVANPVGRVVMVMMMMVMVVVVVVVQLLMTWWRVCGQFCGARRVLVWASTGGGRQQGISYHNRLLHCCRPYRMMMVMMMMPFLFGLVTGGKAVRQGYHIYRHPIRIRTGDGGIGSLRVCRSYSQPREIREDPRRFRGENLCVNPGGVRVEGARLRGVQQGL